MQATKAMSRSLRAETIIGKSSLAVEWGSLSQANQYPTEGGTSTTHRTRAIRLRGISARPAKAISRLKALHVPNHSSNESGAPVNVRAVKSKSAERNSGVSETPQSELITCRPPV